MLVQSPICGRRSSESVVSVNTPTMENKVPTAGEQQPEVAVETARIALEETRALYAEETERLISLFNRATSMISLSGVVLTIYVAFALRPLAEVRFEKF